MKTNKLKTAASLLLTASIAFMSTACTVEFSDPDGSVDKLVEAVEKSEIKVEADTADSSEATNSNDKKSSSSEAQDINKKRDDVNLGENSKSTKPSDTSDKTEPSEAEMTTKETESSKETKDSKTTEPSKENKDIKTTEATETTAKASTSSETKTTKVLEDCCIPFDFYNLTLDCDAGSFAVKAENNKGIVITYNGKEYRPEFLRGTDLCNPFAPVYVQNNGSAYLYIGSSIEDSAGFRHGINVYKLEDDSITFIGAIDGVCPLAQKMTDPDSFITYENPAEELGIDIARIYKVDDTSGMPVPASDIRYFSEVTDAVSFPEDVTGYRVVNGEVTTEQCELSKDVYVRLYETDGETYLDVQLKSGEIVRLDWTEKFAALKVDDNNKDRFRVHNTILNNIDAQIPCYDF